MITLRIRSKKLVNGLIESAGQYFPCAIGRTGTTALKREGDGATPIGSWRFMTIYYRADRVARPYTSLPTKIIKPSDGWCDAPTDRNYNRPVNLPYPASAENMWREDHQYDLVAVLDYNISQRVKGRGSAIFMHLAKPGFTPTEGCIALTESNFRSLLKNTGPKTSLIIPAV